MKLLSLVIFSLILACSQNTDNYATQADKMVLAEVSNYALEKKEEISSESYDSRTSEVIPLEQKIIKNGHLRFHTEDLDQTHARIKKLTEKYQGILQEDRSGKSYNELYRNITIRIPSKNFEVLMDSISKGVKYFDTNDVTQQDVSEEFVDLQARLKAKRELENRYLELLKQAKNVGEILQIERELSIIREEIEARQGRLNFLENRVSYSTLNVYLYKTTSDKGITISYGSKMVNALKSGWNGISLFFLGLLHIWPFFVILFIGIFILRRYLRKRKA